MKKTIMIMLGACLLPLSAYCDLSDVECLDLKLRIANEYSIRQQYESEAMSNLPQFAPGTPQEIINQAQREHEQAVREAQQRENQVNATAKAFNDNAEQVQIAAQIVYEENCTNRFDNVTKAISVSLDTNAGKIKKEMQRRAKAKKVPEIPKEDDSRN